MNKELLEIIRKIAEKGQAVKGEDVKKLYAWVNEKLKAVKNPKADELKVKFDELLVAGDKGNQNEFRLNIIEVIVEIIILLINLNVNVITTTVVTETEIKDNELEIVDVDTNVETEVKDNNILKDVEVEVKDNNVLEIEGNEIYVDKSRDNRVYLNFFNFGNIGENNNLLKDVEVEIEVELEKKEIEIEDNDETNIGNTKVDVDVKKNEIEFKKNKVDLEIEK